PEFSQFLRTLRVLGSQHRSRPTPDEALIVEPAAHGFLARPHAEIFLEQGHDGATRPATTVEAEVPRRLHGHPLNHQADHPMPAWSSTTFRFQNHRQTASEIALPPAVDGARAG